MDSEKLKSALSEIGVGKAESVKRQVEVDEKILADCENYARHMRMNVPEAIEKLICAGLKTEWKIMIREKRREARLRKDIGKIIYQVAK